MIRGSCEVEIGTAERLVLLPQLAAWLPARRMVLAADLHLGKAETMQGDGLHMPRNVLKGLMDETLARLSDAAAVVEGFGGGEGVERIVILGDLIHAPRGVTEDVRECWEGWVTFQREAGRRIVCVRGNHDRKLEVLCGGMDVEVVEELEEDGVVFTHDPREVREGRVVMGGHLHPAFVVGTGRSSMKLPAFVVGPERVVMPAFTKFVAGGAVKLGEGEKVFVVGAGEVIGVGRPELKAESPKLKAAKRSRQ